ncbi:ATP-binding cassette subfamily B protein [Breznakia blatticola]|uniref:ATP-binding cassette subfamily B protein n=2 Tax=Breznakia blatticola TaxID=1754012 RepID=A0A4R7ZBB0_9FIRM|nr:ATP-binding cassette subfamily B protein [Breznakia blatticola]
MVVGLLYGQAQAELALPDYMSDIISNGIQAGGFDSGVPEMMSKDTYDHTLIFMNTKEAKVMEDSYEYIAFADIKNDELPEEIDLSNTSVIKDSGIYVLKDLSDAKFEKLDEVMNVPFLMVNGMESISNGNASYLDEDQAKQMQEVMDNLPEGMSIFDALQMQPKEETLKMVDEQKAKLEELGSMASMSMVKGEYERLGVDTQRVQNNYIFATGTKMLAISLGGVICAILVGFIASLIGNGVARRMRQDVFEKVESFSNEEFNKFSTASLITRTTNDIQQIQMILIMGMRIIIYSPILAFGAIMRVLNDGSGMIWIIVLVVAVIMGIMATTFAVAGPKFKIVQKLIDKINLVMREDLSGMLVIRAFHTEKYEEARMEKANRDQMKVQLFTGRTMAVVMPLVQFIFSATSLLIVWVAAHQIDLGNMQIGQMIAFIQYAMQIIMSFMMIAIISIMLPRASASAARVFEVLNTKLHIQDPETPKTFDTNEKGYVEFKNVSFRYPGAEEDVLHDISFVAKPRQTTAFIGSTGSGKSTIVNLIPRFFDTTGGTIEVDGVNIKDVTQQELRKKIGLVPQKGVLFSGTIESNIKYSDENMSDKQMQLAADVAQATEFISQKPEGFESEIAQGGSNVSGGQKQRLSIARAVAKNPEIYIFDDSFSALDFKTDATVREALNKLVEKTGSTILVVAQRVSSIMQADQIIVLDEGSIVAKGTHEELMKSCEVYQEIAYSQLSKEELDNE